MSDASPSANDQIVAWRRLLHAIPELAFEEHKTSTFILERLGELDVEVVGNVGGTGIVATLASGKAGPTIGFRADMDCLPMDEAATFAHRSTHPSRAHTCGHDGHMAALLGLAAHLSINRPQTGAVRFIFQPAEETASGAMRMIKDGLFERFPCDEVYAFHGMPLFKSGEIGVRAGPVLTGYTIWEINIVGVGGHGAAPHKARDPLQIAARLASDIAAIVGRHIDPMQPAVITTCSLQAGGSYNVIPQRAALSGTLRAVTHDTQAALLTQLQTLCNGYATMSGCTIDMTTKGDCPPCINAAPQAALAAEAAASIVGADQVIANHAPLPFTDDFAHMLARWPGAYLFIGQDGPMCHDPNFDFEDANLATAVKLFARIVEKRLGIRQATSS